jgi:cell division protein ZapA (FtsZ GTPase activity inhibitor)
MNVSKREKIERKRSDYEIKLLQLGKDLSALQEKYRDAERKLEQKSEKYQQKLERLGDDLTALDDKR